MLKLIGSVIVVCATTTMGFYYAGVYAQRVKQLRLIQYALNSLESEIVYTSTPLIEAFENVSAKSNEPIKKLFSLMSKNLMGKNTEGVLSAFEEARNKVSNSLYFDKKEMEIIASFMNSLGNSDIEGQKKNFNITIKKLEAFELDAEERRKKNEKLFRYLGVSAGMLIIIILV